MARTQAERSQTTISGLIAVARARFGTDGYAGTSIEDIVSAAGVTRGTFYHHFESKIDVFRAVVESEQRTMTRFIIKGSESYQRAWERFRAGCRLFLDVCLNPSVRRILLLDGPAVLGWEAVREIEARYTLALLRDGLRAAAQEERLTAHDVDTLAPLLFATLAEGGRLIAKAAHPRQVLRRVSATVDRLLEGIRRSGRDSATTRPRAS